MVDHMLRSGSDQSSNGSCSQPAAITSGFNLPSPDVGPRLLNSVCESSLEFVAPTEITFFAPSDSPIQPQPRLPWLGIAHTIGNGLVILPRTISSIAAIIPL